MIQPRYGAGSLADLLPSVLSRLGVPGETDVLDLATELDGVRRVAVLLVDGLGWHQVPLAGPLLRSLPARVLTSGFPVDHPDEPGQPRHGGTAGRARGRRLLREHPGHRSGPQPHPVAGRPGSAHAGSRCRRPFDRAAAAGLRTCVVTNPDFEGSGLTVSAYRGAAFRGASTVDDLAREMLAAPWRAASLRLRVPPRGRPPGHLYGVDSPPWRTAVAEVDRLVTAPARTAAGRRRAAGHRRSRPARRTVGAPARPRRLDPRCARGSRVVAGEPRVRYLHTLPGARDDVLATWRAILGAARLDRHPRGGRRPTAGTGRCREVHLRPGSATWWSPAGTGTRSWRPRRSRPMVSRLSASTARPRTWRWRSRCSSHAGCCRTAVRTAGAPHGPQRRCVPKGGSGESVRGPRSAATTPAARCCTSTWTPSTPRSRCAGVRSCAASR